MTLASPDPQAFRPPGDRRTCCTSACRPTSRRRASSPTSTPTLLRELEADIEQARFRRAAIEIPVKLKVHDSLFVPLAKWPMLIAGNYRCIRAERHDSHPRGGARRTSTRSREDLRVGGEAVQRARRRRRPTWCRSRNTRRPPRAWASPRPRRAPCSAARCTSTASTGWCGASPARRGLQSGTLHEIVALVDERLARNRAKRIEAPKVEALASIG